MGQLRRTQKPKCPPERVADDCLYDVVTERRGGALHHRLKCVACGTVAGNAAKPKSLVRYDSELARQRREELRRRKANDSTLRKRAA